jgi:hypothetical protein
VWLKAYNTGEGDVIQPTLYGPRAKVKTTCEVDPFWYEGVDRWYMADFYTFTPTTVAYNFGTYSFPGTIVHHEEFDPADVAANPALSWTKYGEAVAGLPAGVFILKREDLSPPLYLATYYWGRGFQVLGNGGITYTMSYIINTIRTVGSYEEALDDFSMERFGVHNAGVAAPYRREMLSE